MRVFKYRIRSNRDGVISMQVRFPEIMLNSFLSYLGVKQRQEPKFSREEFQARAAKYEASMVRDVSREYDACLPRCESPRKAVSSVLRNLKGKYPCLSHDNLKFLLRKSGKLKGTGL